MSIVILKPTIPFRGKAFNLGAVLPCLGACLLAVTTVLFVSTPTASAQDGPVVTESSLETDGQLTIGKPFVFTVTVEHDGQADVDFSSPPPESRWRLVDISREQGDSGNRSSTTATIHFVIHRTGPTWGPPISAIVDDGESVTELPLDHHPVEVITLTDEDAGLGPPRNPWPLLQRRWLLAWMITGSLGLGLIALVGTLVVRRRRNGDDPPPRLPPHELALRDLDELRDTSLVEERRWNPYYVRLSHILRRYLGQRWSFPGTELTTTELVEQLQNVDELDVDIEVIDRWLRECDQVKFAGVIPTADRARALLEEAIQIVETTEPVQSRDGDGQPLAAAEDEEGS